MAQITFDSEEVRGNLDKFANSTLDAEVNDGINKACQILLASAIENCPIDSGQLKGSLTMDVDEVKHKGTVGTNVEYAPYVEIGTGVYSSQGTGRQDAWVYKDAKGNFHKTKGTRPQPFLKPALEENREKIIEVVKDAIKID